MNCGATDNISGDVMLFGSMRCGPGRVLVIGYGNTLRSDDGVGAAVVSQLAKVLRQVETCECMVVHQLTPELAEPISRAQRVVFVDASSIFPAGRISIQPAYARVVSTVGLGHHMTPEHVLGLSQELYGNTPQAWTIGIGVDSMEVGETLSVRVAYAAGRVAEHLAHCVECWSRTPAVH